MIKLLFTACCLLFTVPIASAEIKEFTLTVTEGKIDLGGTQFDVWRYNETVPGPVIRVKEGDTVRIKLKNMSGAKHGLFFHGIHVPAKVSLQEEVSVDPGYEYSYEFVAKPSGTHLYHCSANMAHHLSMGMYGAIIVEGKNEEKFDKDLIYILNDWSSKGAKGESHHEMGHPRTLMDNDIVTVNDKVVKDNDPIVLEVKQGERVRLRFANIGHLPQMLRFPGGFTVTHEDGYAVPKPEKREEIIVYPGKRHDIVVASDKTGEFPFYQSIKMPKGVGEVLMEQSAKHNSDGHKKEKRASAHSEHGMGAMHTVMAKEVPILAINVKRGHQ